MTENEKAIENKERFLMLCETNIKREGIKALTNWLSESTDFFEAPASTRYHSSFKGGLCSHSLNVYDRLLDEVDHECGAFNDEKVVKIQGKEVSLESITIIALFHDLSKTNYYLQTTRNVKTNGQWEQVPYYQVNPNPDFSMIYGSHAENSVYMLGSFMLTSHLENVCIRHHMGGKDFTENDTNEKNTTQVFNKSTLALLTHIADMKATFIEEALA